MSTLTRSEKMCLAQFEEESTSERDHEYESEDAGAGWLQVNPFQPRPMRRLSVGTTRMGKTVGAQAAASRVRGAYPHARVVIFAPIPGSYERVDDLLDANASPRDGSPRVERVRPTDFFANGESLSELPAVSVITPNERGDCMNLARGFNRFAAHLHGDETDESGLPVYLIVDDTDQLLSASENIDFPDLMQATRDDPIAFHVLAQRANVEQVQPIPDRYTVIDQYQMGGAETRGWQRRCGVSKDDTVFLNQQANGPQRLSAGDESERPKSAWTLARRAAPTRPVLHPRERLESGSIYAVQCGTGGDYGFLVQFSR